MKGNFHVRFLGECRRGNLPALTRLTFLNRSLARAVKKSEFTNPQKPLKFNFI